MSNFFLKDFNPSVKLVDIQEKPFENGQQILREIFYHLGIKDIEKVNKAVQLFTPAIYKKGQSYLREGETADRIGFIIKGAVEILLGEKDKQQVLFFLTEEDFFADLKSFLHQQPSKLTICFAELTFVLEIAHKDFRQFVIEHPEFGNMFMQIMSSVTAAVTKLNITLKLPTKNRYEKLMKLQPQLFNRFLLQDIASYLGVKQETLSRIRSQLKNDAAKTTNG